MNVFSTEGYDHSPVMLSETINNLNISDSGFYIDGTIGLGGHSYEILQNLKTGFLIGFDRDSNSIEIARQRLESFKNFELFHSSYKDLKNILSKFDRKKVNGILLDLGLSSFQLDNPSRGFSYRYSSELDMRFDLDSSETAKDIIINSSDEELAKIFREFGEERNSFRIAKAIKQLNHSINTDSLTDVINRITPYKYRIKTCARIFQALRIKTNDELDHLNTFLDIFIDFLEPKGRIVIISYHSMEDRMVKNKFRELKKKNILQVLSKKPFIPTDDEISSNRRSRSAKMRVGEKIG
ncbi:MAG: 16S rRNA (cytosine(1402)-N(4))-methyltransferase RsmH [Candidatus Neomarinimicrobiota bacterium]|nr:16S rRNA (cytosine(1402)-N(4))-methyltransferase RsmH [Candidatus Neomarinimicrobiota bacterium]